MVAPPAALPAPGEPPARPGPDIFEREADPRVPPPSALVTGVPFVPWDEAARFWFRERDHANPSTHAAFLMVLGYWGQHWSLTENRAAVRRWGLADARRAASLDELKPFVAAGIPVIVDAALTPIAHALAAGTDRGRSSSSGAPSPPGVLGPLVQLGDHPAPEAGAPSGRDSLFVAFRVLVGYDDDARQVVLHDPAFGPALRLDYDDFERMWAFTGRAYIVMQPWDPAPVVESRRGTAAYRARTPSEQGAEDFVLAAALAVAGRHADARARLERGLDRSGLDSGAEHLLRLELAAYLLSAGNANAARADAERAAWLVPEHHRVWGLLAEVYRRLGLTEAAAAGVRRAEKLVECGEVPRVEDDGSPRPLPEEAYERAQRLAAEQLARRFFVAITCDGSSATWLLRPLPPPAPRVGGQPR